MKQIKPLFQVKRFQRHILPFTSEVGNWFLVSIQRRNHYIQTILTVGVLKGRLLKKSLPAAALPLWVLPRPGRVLLPLGAPGAMTDATRRGLERETCSCTLHGT